MASVSHSEGPTTRIVFGTPKHVHLSIMVPCYNIVPYAGAMFTSIIEQTVIVAHDAETKAPSVYEQETTHTSDGQGAAAASKPPKLSLQVSLYDDNSSVRVLIMHCISVTQLLCIAMLVACIAW